MRACTKNKNSQSQLLLLEIMNNFLQLIIIHVCLRWIFRCSILGEAEAEFYHIFCFRFFKEFWCCWWIVGYLLLQLIIRGGRRAAVMFIRKTEPPISGLLLLWWCKNRSQSRDGEIRLQKNQRFARFSKKERPAGRPARLPLPAQTS